MWLLQVQLTKPRIDTLKNRSVPKTSNTRPGQLEHFCLSPSVPDAEYKLCLLNFACKGWRFKLPFVAWWYTTCDIRTMITRGDCLASTMWKGADKSREEGPCNRNRRRVPKLSLPTVCFFVFHCMCGEEFLARPIAHIHFRSNGDRSDQMTLLGFIEDRYL